MVKTDEIRDVLEHIHLIQTRLGDLNGRLRRGPVLLKTQEGNIQKFTAKLEKLQGEHRTLVAEAKKREQEVAAHDQAIARRKQQLQEAKTNKDYQALQLQIQTDESARGALDDVALEAMDKAENFAKNFPPPKPRSRKSKNCTKRRRKSFFPKSRASNRRLPTILNNCKPRRSSCRGSFGRSMTGLFAVSAVSMLWRLWRIKSFAAVAIIRYLLIH